MFSQHSGYSLLPGSTSGSRRTVRGFPIFVLVSIVLNIILAIVLAWPFVFGDKAPLDNFQDLHHQPVLNEKFMNSSGFGHNPQDNAVVTTLYSDTFATAVATLGHGLSQVNTSARLILLYFPDSVSNRALCIATSTGFVPHPITRIAPPHGGAGVFPHFIDQFSKLNLWSLDQIGVQSLVYLDADTLVRQNFDELFDLPYNFGAVPDVYLTSKGFTLGFNAGVLFVRPSSAVLENMIARLETATFPMLDAEQGFLNLYYGTQTLRLPYIYNANIAIKKRNRLVWDGLKDGAKIVHYTLAKPFVQGNWEEVPWEHLEDHVQNVTMKKHGSYKEELEWWLAAWKSTLGSARSKIEKCSVPP